MLIVNDLAFKVQQFCNANRVIQVVTNPVRNNVNTSRQNSQIQKIFYPIEGGDTTLPDETTNSSTRESSPQLE